jgi:hypothetical protein
METPIIPQRAAGTRSPYTEEEIYYLTHPETWIPQTQPLPRRQNAVHEAVAEVEAPLMPPLPRRQNAVHEAVAEVEASLMPPLPRRQNAVHEAVAEVKLPLVPPLPRRQNAVVGAEAVHEAITEADGKMRSCSSLAEALEFLARFETTP